MVKLSDKPPQRRGKEKFAVAAQTSFSLETRGAVEDVQVEFVSDDVCQVLINIDTRPHRIDRGPWNIVHAVLLAATMIEAETGEPLRSFLLTFTQAWNHLNSQKTKDLRR